MLYIDFETYSECNIKKADAYTYAKHKSTRVICYALVFNDTRLSELSDHLPDDIVGLIENDRVKIYAWNAIFEYYILKYVLKLDVKINQMIGLASIAVYLNLPRSLGACLSLIHISEPTRPY